MPIEWLNMAAVDVELTNCMLTTALRVLSSVKSKCQSRVACRRAISLDANWIDDVQSYVRMTSHEMS